MQKSQRKPSSQSGTKSTTTKATTTTTTTTKLTKNKKVIKTAQKRQMRSQSFKSTKTSLNSRRDKFAESVLNIIKPKKTAHSLLTTIPVSQPGDIIPTGALLAPIRNVSHKDGYDMSKVKNKIPLPEKGLLSKEQITNRRIFFNTFPRQSASPAGHLLQTQYTNYSVYRGVIDYAKRLPGVNINISVKERVDYQDRFDSRWYAEAMARPRARVELNVKNLKFLTPLERDLMGEILGPRYNWQTGRVVVSIGNLREIHASINRCFQLIHEAAFRAIEISPHIQASADIENGQYKSQVQLIQAEEQKVNDTLKSLPVDKLFFTRALHGKKTPVDQRFLTTDHQHYIPFNPEFTIDDHLKYLPEVNLEKMLLADTIPPGMAKALQRRKDFDQEALAADPTLDPEQIVSPGIEPYSYMSRARLLQAVIPAAFENLDDEDFSFDEEAHRKSVPTAGEQIADAMDMFSEVSMEDAEAYAVGAVLNRELHPLDIPKAIQHFKWEIQEDKGSLDWLASDGDTDPEERWKDTQFAPR